MHAALVLTAMVLHASPLLRDLEDACQLAQKLTAAKPETYAGRHPEWWETRYVRWLEKLESTPHQEVFTATLQALAHVANSDRVQFLQHLGKDAGQPTWTCPALEKLLAPADADLSALCERASKGEIAALADFRFDSPPANAAWKVAQEKTGAAGFAVLQTASEWPEQTFRDCDGLKRILNALDLQRQGAAKKPAPRGKSK